MVDLTDTIHATHTTQQHNRMLVMIGASPYKINVHFNNAATESMSDKIMRLIRNEVETAATSTSIITDTKAVTSS